jgi:hypothetical protein
MFFDSGGIAQVNNMSYQTACNMMDYLLLSTCLNLSLSKTTWETIPFSLSLVSSDCIGVLVKDWIFYSISWSLDLIYGFWDFGLSSSISSTLILLLFGVVEAFAVWASINSSKISRILSWVVPSLPFMSCSIRPSYFTPNCSFLSRWASSASNYGMK